MKDFSKLQTALCFLCFCFLLSACEREPGRKDPQPVEPIDIQPPVDVTPAPPEDPVSVNLSRRLLDDVADEGADSLGPREQMLPDMFEATGEEEKKTRLQGGLLLKEQAADVRDMVDGIEVKIEIPTG